MSSTLQVGSFNVLNCCCRCNCTRCCGGHWCNQSWVVVYKVDGCDVEDATI
jgi:hypothetical protein